MPRWPGPSVGYWGLPQVGNLVQGNRSNLRGLSFWRCVIEWVPKCQEPYGLRIQAKKPGPKIWAPAVKVRGEFGCRRLPNRTRLYRLEFSRPSNLARISSS